MFKRIKNVVTGQVKRSVRISDYINEAKQTSYELNQKESSCAVDEHTTISDYKKRYVNVIAVQYILLLFVILMVGLSIANASIMNVAIYSLATIILSMFYLKYSLTSWRARLVFVNWDDRHEDFTVTMQDYLDALAVNPFEILPLRLKAAKVKT